MKHIYTYVLLVMLPLGFSLNSLAVTHVITLDAIAFNPSNLEVNVGDVIRWEWESGVHTTTSVTVPQGASPWDTPIDNQAQTFEYTVQVAGEYQYTCLYHGQMGMNGSFNAAGSTSVEPVLAGQRDFTVGMEFGSKILHIKMDNGAAAYGAIRLYDIMGKSVALIYEGNLGYEEHAIGYDASAIGRGIYFIRLEQKSHVVTRKIMLN